MQISYKKGVTADLRVFKMCAGWPIGSIRREGHDKAGSRTEPAVNKLSLATKARFQRLCGRQAKRSGPLSALLKPQQSAVSNFKAMTRHWDSREIWPENEFFLFAPEGDWREGAVPRNKAASSHRNRPLVFHHV
jgi:hypothetical protein